MVRDNNDFNNSISLDELRKEKINEIIVKFTDHNGNFDYENFKNYIEENGEKVIREGYGLNFLGKRAAELLAGQESTTVFVPDIEHNEKEENKNSENIYISADNLEALRHLKHSYYKKIKCIYIDPPYNTGKDGFCYPDNFKYDKENDKETLSEKLGVSLDEAERILSMESNRTNSHSAWLSFMYARLLIARELLTDDGVIFISIDDNEMANAKLLCDEVFGEGNFINVFMWLHGKGKKNKNSRTLEQYIICYAKNIQEIKEWEVKKATTYVFTNPDNDPKGKWFSGSISFDENRSNELHENYYEIVSPSGIKWKRQWQVSKEEMDTLIEDGDIYWGTAPNYDNTPRKKIRPSEEEVIPPNIYNSEDVGTTRSAQKQLDNMFAKKIVFDNPKPIKLIKNIIKLNAGEMVLDFFSGSATTTHAVMELNSEMDNYIKVIAVQLPENLDELLKNSSNEKSKKTIKNQIVLCDECGYPHTLDYIGIERIKRAAVKIKKETGADIDYGFKHFTLVDRKETLSTLEEFNPGMPLLTQDEILKEYSVESRIITMLCEDGYGLTPKYEVLDLDGYKAYYIDKRLYLVEKDFDSKNIMALLKLMEKEDLVINKVVIFGYAFSTKELQQLKDNAEKIGIDDDKDIIIKY